MNTKEEKDSYMGRMVHTIKPMIDDRNDARKWNVTGRVQDVSNSLYGLCYEVKHDDGTIAWYDPSELEFVETAMEKTLAFCRNKLVNDKFAGKTIEKIDATAVNSWLFHFKDNTQVSLEVEAIFPSMGLYGIGISEPGWDPQETMGPGCKPGDARREIKR